MKQQERTVTKVCKRCEVEKNISEFHSWFDGRRQTTCFKANCKACNNAITKENYYGNEQLRANKLKAQAVLRATEEYKNGAKEYHQKYNALNAEKISLQKKEYRLNPDVKDREKSRLAKSYLENRDEIIEKRRLFYVENPDNKQKHVDYLKQHYVNNKDYYVEKSTRRTGRIVQCKPSWYDLKPILALRKEARRLTKETGIPHEVDHIIPVQGKLVTGLHCIANMQILTRSENKIKSNKHIG